MKYNFPMIIFVAYERICIKLMLFWSNVRSRLLVWLWGINASGKISFRGPTIVRTHKRGDISVGKNVIFNANVRTNLVGLLGPTILDTIGGGKIEIGDDSGFSSVVMSTHSNIKIGSRVKVGGNARIYDHDFHSLNPQDRTNWFQDRRSTRTRPIIIGDDCFIGYNAIILKGTVLGDRTIVAAGSVVMGLNVPSDSMVKGNPAAVINTRH